MKTIFAAFFASLLLAQAPGVPELNLELPRPARLFQFSTPGQIIKRLETTVRDIFVPPICPVVQPKCNLVLKDVESPANNYRVTATCSGGTEPCTLYATKSPRKAIGVFSGSFSADLDLDEIGATAVLYELYDKNNQLCGRETAHAFRVGGTAPVQVAASSAYTQSGYRWLINANSVTPGSALAALNTRAQVDLGIDPQVRLRLLLHVADAALAASGQSFKLQIATEGASCSTATYADVASGSGSIRFYNNASPADADVISSVADDPTHGSDTLVYQTYEEANNFTNPSAIAAGADGIWDFALADSTGNDQIDYCFRVVKSDGTVIDTYSQYPQICFYGEAASCGDDP